LEGGRGGQGLPPLRPSGRGSLDQFQHPRPSAVQPRSGCGGSQATHLGASRSRSLTTGAGSGGQPTGSVPQGPTSGGVGALGGGGHGGRVAIGAGCGSTSVGNNFAPPEDVEGEDDIEEEDDNDFDGHS